LEYQNHQNIIKRVNNTQNLFHFIEQLPQLKANFESETPSALSNLPDFMQQEGEGKEITE